MNVPLCFRAARSRRARGPAPWAALPPVGAGAGAGAGARAKSGVAEEEDELERPLHFSSSKASPRRWTVEHSLGSDRHRPWWKVLPLSISLLALICWCFWRVETDVDRWLTGSAEGQAPEAEVDPERRAPDPRSKGRAPRFSSAPPNAS